jgi:hypothetical protein
MDKVLKVGAGAVVLALFAAMIVIDTVPSLREAWYDGRL